MWHSAVSRISRAAICPNSSQACHKPKKVSPENGGFLRVSADCLPRDAFQAAYIRSVIDQVEVDDEEIRIMGGARPALAESAALAA